MHQLLWWNPIYQKTPFVSPQFLHGMFHLTPFSFQIHGYGPGQNPMRWKTAAGQIVSWNLLFTPVRTLHLLNFEHKLLRSRDSSNVHRFILSMRVARAKETANGRVKRPSVHWIFDGTASVSKARRDYGARWYAVPRRTLLCDIFLTGVFAVRLSVLGACLYC